MTDNERRIYLLRIRGLEEDIDSCIDIDKNNLLEIERLRKLVLDQDAFLLMDTKREGYWWVEGSTLDPYIVRVDSNNVFMWGDSTWYKQEQFVFLGKVKDHDNGTTASS